MINSATINKIDQSLLNRLDPDGKLNIAACLQCGRCSSGCTMRMETDILPHQINRMVMLGMEKQLLSSKAIWACASCHTCVSRCPMGVNTPELIDRLRILSGEMPEESCMNTIATATQRCRVHHEGNENILFSKDVKQIRTFNNTMLGSMKQFGRVYEFGMMGEYKLRSHDLFSDVLKFPTMLIKGKMKLLPPSVKERKKVAEIFERVRQARRAR